MDTCDKKQPLNVELGPTTAIINRNLFCFLLESSASYSKQEKANEFFKGFYERESSFSSNKQRALLVFL